MMMDGFSRLERALHNISNIKNKSEKNLYIKWNTEKQEPESYRKEQTRYVL